MPGNYMYSTLYPSISDEAEVSHKTIKWLIRITAFFAACRTVALTSATSFQTAGGSGEEAKIQREVDEG